MTNNILGDDISWVFGPTYRKLKIENFSGVLKVGVLPKWFEIPEEIGYGPPGPRRNAPSRRRRSPCQGCRPAPGRPRP